MVIRAGCKSPGRRILYNHFHRAMTIRIVTDSTCDLPKETIKELGIGVVPQYINIGDKSYLDEIDLSRRDFYEHLADYDVHPTTAAPGISAFGQIYKKLITEGTSQILSIHISKKLSSTLDAAQSAANEIDEIPIIVGQG